MAYALRGGAFLTLLAAGAVLGLSSCALLPPAPPASDYIGPATHPPAPAGASENPPAYAPSPQSQPAAPEGPLSLTVQEAILMTLERNQALSVERLNPSIQRTFEQEQRAAFDPTVAAEIFGSNDRAPLSSGRRETTGDYGASATVSQSLPTGTDVTAGLTGDLLTSNLGDDQYVTRLGLTINQALLRGAGLDVNLASVRQARLDTLASEYELRGFAQALVAETETAYWNYALAQRTIDIVNDALQLAEQQVRETEERIKVGALAETEVAAAAAELARRKENLINARSALATIRLGLLRLLNPAAKDFWDREITLTSTPAVPQVHLDDVATYVQVALRLRPELNQARLGVRRDDLELVKTRNGLLPRMDLFISLGKSGYANSFGESFGNLPRQDYDAFVGLRMEYPPANREAQALHHRAQYTRQQALRAVDNLAQLAQVDVRAAYIEVDRSREQVAATAATRKYQEETLRAETEKFRVGKSTSFLVAQAQRDLLQSQIAEVQAVVSYLKALIQLHLQEGALLERRGIVAPGAKPVDAPPPPRQPVPDARPEGPLRD